MAGVIQLAHIRMVEDATKSEAEVYRDMTGHPGDAVILATAVKAGCDAVVTDDRRHLLTERVKREAPIWVGTAGDIIQRFFSSPGTLLKGQSETDD